MHGSAQIWWAHYTARMDSTPNSWKLSSVTKAVFSLWSSSIDTRQWPPRRSNDDKNNWEGNRFEAADSLISSDDLDVAIIDTELERAVVQLLARGVVVGEKCNAHKYCRCKLLFPWVTRIVVAWNHGARNLWLCGKGRSVARTKLKTFGSRVCCKGEVKVSNC